MELAELLTYPPLRAAQGVLDYVADDGGDYCDNFSDQWNRFRIVQIDSESGSTESQVRFLEETGWSAEELSGKLLLDAGCGAGRFAEVALSYGARVVAVDLSQAVWACRETLSRFPSSDYLVIRADLFHLPLKLEAFYGVYSLGVLQHTPDPLEGVRRLAAHVAPGGRLATWIYTRHVPDLTPLFPKTWIRALTKNLGFQQKLMISKLLVAWFFPLGWMLSWFGRVGERASAFLPYAARHNRGRGNLKRQWVYGVQDTYDWYGPLYDRPQRERDVVEAMRGAGLVNIRRLPARGMAIAGEQPETRKIAESTRLRE